MSDTRKSLLADYDEWTADRTELSEAESNGTEPSSSDWQGSDDTGIDLAHRFASLLTTDDATAAQDLAADAVKHLLAVHIEQGWDADEAASALIAVVRDAITETFDHYPEGSVGPWGRKAEEELGGIEYALPSEVCANEDCRRSLDDGEGYDGECGDCADRTEAARAS